MNLTNKYLRIIKPIGDILPADIIVWCLIDHDEDGFRVRTMQDYHGVREIWLSTERRDSIEIYWQ